MSFRHTFITEYLYKYGMAEELKEIEGILKKYGYAEWHGAGTHNQYGYFHGVFKDYNGYDMQKGGEGDAIIKELADKGIKIAIVYE